MTGLWGTLLFSLLIALPATALAALVGVPLAYFMARRQFTGKSLVEALVIIPLVLPPTVVGYVLIMMFGRRSLLGEPIANLTRDLATYFDPQSDYAGYGLLFTPEGGVLAAAVVAMPLLYLPAKAAFASIEREMEDIAKLNGASGWQTFWLVSLPIASRGVASGLVLGFARALGEFGATVMVMGLMPSRPMTLPVLVYSYWEQGTPSAAIGPVLLLSGIALLLAILFNRLPRG